MTPLAFPVSMLLLVLVLVAALFDLRFRRIPNWLVAAGAAAAFTVNGWLSGMPGVGTAAAGLGVALLVYVPLFAIRATGAGDVKLMAAVGAFVGPLNWMILFLITSLAGGALAMVLVIATGRLAETLRNVGFILAELAHLRAPHDKRQHLDMRHPNAVTLPHGAVIALASMLFLFLAR